MAATARPVAGCGGEGQETVFHYMRLALGIHFQQDGIHAIQAGAGHQSDIAFNHVGSAFHQGIVASAQAGRRFLR
jgi:hypothetical protein